MVVQGKSLMRDKVIFCHSAPILVIHHLHLNALKIHPDGLHLLSKNGRSWHGYLEGLRVRGIAEIVNGRQQFWMMVTHSHQKILGHCVWFVHVPAVRATDHSVALNSIT